MSNTIDERVVSMKFENGNFQSGVSSTLSALAKLKQGLNLTGAAKGIEEVQAAGNKFNLGSMGRGVEQIGLKFEALKTIGIAALATLASQGVMYGQKLLAGMTEGITSGFSEYELKMGSIQTILANTAKDNTNLKQVSASLNELNTYADKTIYNFGDMTKNIGLFTNAGIKLEDATSMIKGFSNEAAASGTSSEGAAGAAYQLSQALSAGTIRLMDWRSLQNVGMGNKNMQRGIIDIASAMGTFNKDTTDAKSATKDFNGSLEKGWLSADVMSTYLKIMAGDMDAATQKSLGLTDAQIEGFAKQQKMSEDAATKVRTFTALVGTIKESIGSSWATTSEMIFGDFDQATVLFTNINNTVGGMIGRMGDARNKLLGAWAKLGGRDVAIEALTNAGKALMSILKPIGEAWREVFPPATGKQLYDITVAVRDFTKSLILGKDSTEGLKSTFKGVFALLDIGWSIIKGLFGVVGDLFGAFSGGGGSVLQFTGSLADGIVAVRDWLKEGGHLAAFFDGLGAILSAPVRLLVKLGQAIAAFFAGWKGFNLDGLRDAFGRVGEQLKTFGAAFGRVGDRLKVLGGYLREFGAWVGDVFSGLWEKVQPFIGMLGDAFRQVGQAIKEVFKSGDYSKILDTINTGVFVAILLMVRNFFKKLKGFSLFKNLFGGAEEAGGGFLDSIKGVISGVTDTFSAMQASLKAKTLVTIALAIGLITASVIALSLVDSGKLTTSLTAMTVMFGQLAGTMILLEKFALGPGMARMPLLAAGMVLLAGAIFVMSLALNQLAKNDWGSLLRGLTGLVVILGSIVGFAKLMSLGTNVSLMATAASMIVFGFALKVMASAVKQFGELDTGELIRGLIGTVSVLGAIVGFTKLMTLSGTNKSVAVSAFSILLIGSALKLLASAVQDFSKFDIGALTEGLIGVGVVLGLMSAFTRTMGNPLGILEVSAAMVVMGFALQQVAKAVLSFGKMSWESLAKGMAAMAVALGIMVLTLSSILPSDLVSAGALVVAALALVVIGKAMQQFGKMSWSEIGKAMTVLVGSMLILAGALILMEATLPGAAALLVAAAALVVLAPPLIALSKLTWGQIGAGVGALGIALAILAVGGVALLPAIPGLLALGVAVGLIGLGVGVAALGLGTLALGLVAIGTSGPLAAAGITAMATAILNLIPLALAKLAEGIVGFAEVIGESGPALVTAFVALFMSLLDAINTVVPQIITTVFNLMDQLISALAKYAPQWFEKGWQLLSQFLDSIESHIGEVVDKGASIIIKFLQGLDRNMPAVADKGAETLVKFVNAVAGAVENHSGEMAAAGRRLAGSLADGMTGGLFSKAKSIASAAWDLGKRAIQAIRDATDTHSPSREAYKVGAFVGDGFGNAMEDKQTQVGKSAGKLGGSAMAALYASVAEASKAAGDTVQTNPVITPVLDLSRVKAQAGQATAYLTNPRLKTDATYAAAYNARNGIESNKSAEASLSPGSTTKVLEFHQTNNSPKAISSVEVYRNTKNLLSNAKGALDK